jgi:nucleotide-binding universal stress UspA family protein
MARAVRCWKRSKELQMSVRRIVTGVDGSPSSLDALRWAVREAQLGGGVIDAMIAWQYPAEATGLGWIPGPGMAGTDYAEVAAKVLASGVAEVSPPPGVAVRQLVVDGHPAQVLLDAAERADLLVVGSRGHGSFADALLGSVSMRCVHHAQCPVVVVRQPKASS